MEEGVNNAHPAHHVFSTTFQQGSSNPIPRKLPLPFFSKTTTIQLIFIRIYNCYEDPPLSPKASLLCICYPAWVFLGYLLFMPDVCQPCLDMFSSHPASPASSPISLLVGMPSGILKNGKLKERGVHAFGYLLCHHLRTCWWWVVLRCLVPPLKGVQCFLYIFIA